MSYLPCAFNCVPAFSITFPFFLSQSYLFVLGVDYKWPGGGEEFEQA